MANAQLRTAFIQLTFREERGNSNPQVDMINGLYTPEALEDVIREAFKEVEQRVSWLHDFKVVLLQDIAE